VIRDTTAQQMLTTKFLAQQDNTSHGLLKNLALTAPKDTTVQIVLPTLQLSVLLAPTVLKDLTQRITV